MFVSRRAYIYIYIRKYVYVFTHTDIHIYLYTHIDILYIYTYLYIHICQIWFPDLDDSIPAKEADLAAVVHGAEFSFFRAKNTVKAKGERTSFKSSHPQSLTWNLKMMVLNGNPFPRADFQVPCWISGLSFSEIAWKTLLKNITFFLLLERNFSTSQILHVFFESSGIFNGYSRQKVHHQEEQR